MKNLVGYVQFPSEYDGIQLVKLIFDLKKELGVNFWVSKFSVIRDLYIEIELYSNERSWHQDYFADGLYNATIVRNNSFKKRIKNFVSSKLIGYDYFN